MVRYTKGINQYFYKELDKIVPVFCKYNIHPNTITLFNILNVLLFYYNIKNNAKKEILVIHLLLHYVLDCLDGQVARTCNKKTKIGGYLDIFCDNILWSILITYFISKYIFNNYKHFNIFNIIIIIIYMFIIELLLGFNLNTHKNSNKYSDFFIQNTIIFYILLCKFI
jgi:phosphatidylglycerophosphate synthase